MFKIGQKGFIRLPFKIVDFNLQSGVLLIQLYGESGSAFHKIPIPIYLSGLGFDLPAYDWVKPRILSEDEQAKPGNPHAFRCWSPHDFTSCEYLGKRCTIIIPEEFRFNGQFYLQELDTDKRYTKQAFLRDNSQRASIISDMMHAKLDGSTVQGTITSLFWLTKDRARIRFVNSLHEYAKNDPSIVEYYAVLRDPHTDVEFDINIKWIDSL